MSEAFKGGKFAGLTKLKLSIITKFQDADLSVIAKNCPELVELEVKFAKLTNAPFEILVKECKKLRSLSLTRVRNLTNELLKDIALHSPTLRYLSVYLSVARCDDFKKDAAFQKQMKKIPNVIVKFETWK